MSISLSATLVITSLEAKASPQRKKTNEWFFKTKPGQYGHGDHFIGVRVPEVRKIAREFRQLDKSEIKTLLYNPIHEVRLCALLILVEQYEKSKEEEGREKIKDFYLKHDSQINNWDLVDVSVHKIWGDWIFHHQDKVPKLFDYAKSSSLWQRRMAMVATWRCIQKGWLDPTFDLAIVLLRDPEDLMHKAVGWMLREAGKKDFDRLAKFIEKHHQEMPRTMLRYATEKFPKSLYRKYVPYKGRGNA